MERGGRAGHVCESLSKQLTWPCLSMPPVHDANHTGATAPTRPASPAIQPPICGASRRETAYQQNHACPAASAPCNRR